MSNQKQTPEINKNSEALVKRIKDLLERKEISTVNLLLNSHTKEEKEYILFLLTKEREKYIEKGYLDEVEFLSKYLKKPLSEDEKKTFVKNKIKDSFSNPSDFLDQIIKFFPKKEKAYYLQFFIDAELLHSSIKVAQKLGLNLPESFVKKEFKKVLKNGYLPDLKTILNLISEQSGKERVLTSREKREFISNFRIYSLEEFLNCETFLKTPLDPQLLLETRKKAVSGFEFGEAAILSKITGKILTREELIGILDRIFGNFYTFSDKNKKGEIKRLESLLPKGVVREIKTKRFLELLEVPWIEAAKFLAEELEIKISIENYKTMLKNSIMKDNNKFSAILADMKKDYPTQVEQMENK